MIVIFNKQNASNKPNNPNSAGSNRKIEIKSKSKGKGARAYDRPIVEI